MGGLDIICQAICHPSFRNNDIKIKHISCGSKHSLCIDENGICYLFGRNAYGEIGNKQIKQNQYRPFIFQESDGQFKKCVIVDGQCSEWHTVLLSKSNDIITFGRNIHGECSTLLSGQEAISSGYVVDREKEMGINEDDWISDVIVSKSATFIVVDMAKTRI